MYVWLIACIGVPVLIACIDSKDVRGVNCMYNCMYTSLYKCIYVCLYV